MNATHYGLAEELLDLSRFTFPATRWDDQGGFSACRARIPTLSSPKVGLASLRLAEVSLS